VVEIRLVELLNRIQRKRKLHRGDPYRVMDLASEIGLPPGTLIGVLDRLADDGWLKREPDPRAERRVDGLAGLPRA
jgi:DNA-binding MarR family transcriptional regulator